MERKIGKVFEHKGKTLEVVEAKLFCEGCYFFEDYECKDEDYIMHECIQNDGKSVIAKEVKPEHINDITDPVNPEPQMSYE